MKAIGGGGGEAPLFRSSGIFLERRATREVAVFGKRRWRLEVERRVCFRMKEAWLCFRWRGESTHTSPRRSGP